METISYVAGFITIARAVRDLFKRFRKDEEAEAVEKAVKAIESDPNIKADEAKQTFEQTLKRALGNERAGPVIQYTGLVETFFPFKPRGRVLHYGIAIEQLVLEIHRVLYDLDAFKLFGKSHESNRALEFAQTAYSLRGQGITHAIIPEGDYSLSAFLFEGPYTLGGPFGAPIFGEVRMDAYLVLKAKQYGSDFWIFVSTDEFSPFSLTFKASGKTAEKRLEYYEFGHLMNAMISDANSYLQRVAREHEQSREEVEKYASVLRALKELSAG